MSVSQILHSCSPTLHHERNKDHTLSRDNEVPSYSFKTSLDKKEYHDASQTSSRKLHRAQNLSRTNNKSIERSRIFRRQLTSCPHPKPSLNLPYRKQQQQWRLERRLSCLQSSPKTRPTERNPQSGLKVAVAFSRGVRRLVRLLVRSVMVGT